MKETKIEKNISKTDHFDLDLSTGLTDEQVSLRKQDGLTNKITKHVTKSYAKIIADNLVNVFNLILFAIAALMIAAKIPFSSFAFLFILGLNIIIGLIQDIRARRMVDKLKVVSYPIVKVLRNGKEVEIQANEIVYSDIVILKTGDQIICDGEIVEGSIETNESMLTGESVNVLKNIGSSIYSGSFVTSGTCKYRVNALGKANYAEKLQLKAKQFKKPKSEILKTINFFFKFIGIAVCILGASLLITYASFGRLSPEYFYGQNGSIASISGALVSMMPTGMYLLTSLTLAIGVLKLAKKRMLVQELYCIEMLARVDTICFDKTGTLTDGSMNVHHYDVLNKKCENEIESLLITLVTATGDTNSTALAISKKYAEAKVFDIHSGLSFNSFRKFSAVMLKDGRSIVLGAREFIPHKEKKIDDICLGYEKQGLRVLLLGQVNQVVSNETKLGNVEPLAILVLEDHIRDDAIENIEWFKNNGVVVKIISGDNPISVSEIARRVGVSNSDQYISLQGMDIEMVRKIANKYTVFGRVSPEQKEALVSAMQDEGHTVAMTGDGVNDILALKVADCSIAMASGSDAAKNISHLVTMDNNFSTLPQVVAEGRRVINNLQRTCSLFLVKTLFAMIICSIFLVIMWTTKNLDLYKYPFLTNNMYVWELITIGIGSFMLSVQPNNEKLGKYGFQKSIITRTLPAAIVQILVVVTYLIMYNSGIFDFETFKSFSVLTFSITSFVVLFRICLPFDAYRVVLISGLGVATVIMFLLDWMLFKDGKQVLMINYSLLTSSNWWILLVVILGSIPLYILFELASKQILKMIEMKGNK